MFAEARNKYLNKKIKVLLEEAKDGFFYGYSDNYIRVKIQTNEKFKVNDIVEVTAVEIIGDTIIAD